MNEKELILRAKSGDFDAFTTLVAKHQSKIYHLALKMTANQQDAEDVVQETLLKAIDKIDQFRGEAAFGTWLYTIALNQTRAILSKEKSRDLKPVEEYLPSDHSSNNSTDAGRKLFEWKDPHKLLEQTELRGQINKALAELPAQYREAFLLRYFEELPIKEVAKLIGESVAATKSRVMRARLAVRNSLSSIFEDRHGQEV